MEDEVDFLPAQIFYLQKHQRLLEIDIIILSVVTRHAQISQSNKFAISLYSLKKEMSDEVDFLHADKFLAN